MSNRKIRLARYPEKKNVLVLALFKGSRLFGVTTNKNTGEDFLNNEDVAVHKVRKRKLKFNE